MIMDINTIDIEILDFDVISAQIKKYKDQISRHISKIRTNEKSRDHDTYVACLVLFGRYKDVVDKCLVMDSLTKHLPQTCKSFKDSYTGDSSNLNSMLYDLLVYLINNGQHISNELDNYVHIICKEQESLLTDIMEVKARAFDKILQFILINQIQSSSYAEDKMILNVTYYIDKNHLIDTTFQKDTSNLERLGEFISNIIYSYSSKDIISCAHLKRKPTLLLYMLVSTIYDLKMFDKNLYAMPWYGNSKTDFGEIDIVDEITKLYNWIYCIEVEYKSLIDGTISKDIGFNNVFINKNEFFYLPYSMREDKHISSFFVMYKDGYKFMENDIYNILSHFIKKPNTDANSIDTDRAISILRANIEKEASTYNDMAYQYITTKCDWICAPEDYTKAEIVAESIFIPVTHVNYDAIDDTGKVANLFDSIVLSYKMRPFFDELTKETFPITLYKNNKQKDTFYLKIASIKNLKLFASLNRVSFSDGWIPPNIRYKLLIELNVDIYMKGIHNPIYTNGVKIEVYLDYSNTDKPFFKYSSPVDCDGQYGHVSFSNQFWQFDEMFMNEHNECVMSLLSNSDNIYSINLIKKNLKNRILAQMDKVLQENVDYFNEFAHIVLEYSISMNNYSEQLKDITSGTAHIKSYLGNTTNNDTEIIIKYDKNESIHDLFVRLGYYFVPNGKSVDPVMLFHIDSNDAPKYGSDIRIYSPQEYVKNYVLHNTRPNH